MLIGFSFTFGSLPGIGIPIHLYLSYMYMYTFIYMYNVHVYELFQQVPDHDTKCLCEVQQGNTEYTLKFHA